MRPLYSEGAEGVPGGAPAGARPAPSALPCQNSNNCPKPTPGKGYRLRQSATFYRGRAGLAEAVEIRAEEGEGVDREGRCWERRDDGTWVRIFGGISSAEAKRAFALRRNVEAFAEYYRHEACGFLTIAPKDMQPKELAAAWHDMRKHRLKWVRSYVRVLEPQKRGAPHHHLLAATPFDLKPAAFDWEALQGAAEARKRGDLGEARRLTRQYAQSAPECLRACWHELREACEHYGLGRSEFLPFRKEAGAVAHYVGKYLESGLAVRRDEWKGARRVEYDRTESRDWKRCAAAFGWVSPGARAWRIRVAELAAAVGAETPEALVRRLGPRWAYHARPSIMQEPEGEWRKLLAYYADEYKGTVARKPRAKVGAQVLSWYHGSADGNPWEATEFMAYVPE